MRNHYGEPEGSTSDGVQKKGTRTASRFTVSILPCRFLLKCVVRSLVGDEVNGGKFDHDTSYKRYLRWSLFQEVRILVQCIPLLLKKNYRGMDIVLNQVNILPKISIRHRL